MQKAIKRFLTHTKILNKQQPDAVAQVVLDFWAAVALLLRDSWDNPRRSLLCKGVGVYALMGIAGDLVDEAGSGAMDKRYFSNKLADFILDVDWSTVGPFSGLGGEAGVKVALALLLIAGQGSRQIDLSRLKDVKQDPGLGSFGEGQAFGIPVLIDHQASHRVVRPGVTFKVVLPLLLSTRDVPASGLDPCDSSLESLFGLFLFVQAAISAPGHPQSVPAFQTSADFRADGNRTFSQLRCSRILTFFNVKGRNSAQGFSKIPLISDFFIYSHPSVMIFDPFGEVALFGLDLADIAQDIGLFLFQSQALSDL